MSLLKGPFTGPGFRFPHVLLALYSKSDRRGSSGSLVVVVVTVVVTFFHDDVSPQRSFYWAGFRFPGLNSLGGWVSACVVGGVFGVGVALEGFEWFLGGGGGGGGGGDLFSTRFLDF